MRFANTKMAEYDLGNFHIQFTFCSMHFLFASVVSVSSVAKRSAKLTLLDSFVLLREIYVS
jgi:hypothetical protein